jgi:hypothetical protein
MRLLFNTEENKKSEIPEYPSINFHTEYYDIENNFYKKSYCMKPENTFLGRPVSNLKTLEINYKLGIKDVI